MTFQFAAPWLLTLVTLLPLLAYVLHRKQARHQTAGLRFASVGLLRQQRTWRATLRPLLTAGRLLALALLIIGLARPQLAQAKEIVRGEGVDIVIAQDISGSMAALDFQPQNRLEAAKAVVDDFISRRTYDRIGLVVFAHEAFSQAPMTTDHAVLNRLLKQVQLAPELQLEDGTAIGLGLANAANMLKDSDAKSRVVILLTDGANNAGEIAPETAAEAAQTLGIKVYTIGMGRPGQVPVPVDGLFGGQEIVYRESDLDEGLLQQIAEKTGGQYFRATDTADLQRIYDHINQLEKSQIEITRYSEQIELMLWALLPALALVLSEQVLSQTLFRRIP
ncbi:MAG: VWA domain-containing protein [Chloroflexi bacterium]|nr:VWA domain-containing protein [Chloroflexota bacterium]